ncbi:MAG: GIY-YIG nuclease family protein [Sporichthyaceae bacterium]
MLIGAYGMFWSREEVDWNPGSGPNAWQLLGSVGKQKPKLRVADFRRARGVYILFDHFGAHYVGLARGSGGIGERLKAHTADRHAASWERFCWFSFDGVGEKTNAHGMTALEPRSKPVPTQDESVIGELEALLITILGTRGQNKMRFERAEQWSQVPFHASDALLGKLRKS